MKAEIHAAWLFMYLPWWFIQQYKEILFAHICSTKIYLICTMCLVLFLLLELQNSKRPCTNRASILVGNQINRQEKYCIFDINMLNYVTGNYRIATVDYVFEIEHNI